MSGFNGNKGKVMRVLSAKTLGAIAAVLMGVSGAAAEDAVCLSQPLTFADDVVTGCLSAEDAAALADRPVLLGKEGAGKTLELTHPINIRQKKQVRTCNEYRAAAGEDWFAMTTYDMTIEGHFQKRCVLLDLVARARPARQSHLPKSITEEDIGNISVSVLALFDPEGTAGLDSAAEEGRTLKDFADGGSLEVKDQSAAQLSMEYRAMSGTLQELARGDFTGDGIKDALMSCGVHAKEGSYRVTDLMVVTKLSADGALQAVSPGDGS